MNEIATERAFAVEYAPDDRIMFQHPIMSAPDGDQAITVSQSINGARLFLSYRGRRYSIDVQQLAVAWVEAVKADER